MPEASESVKPIVVGLRELASKSTKSPYGAKFEAWATTLDTAISRMLEMERLTKAIPQTFGDISDIPEELRAELNIGEGDELENQIATVVNACGGAANIDQILIGLFRKFKVSQKRRFVQNKLYRMIKNDMLWNVPERKGLYTTTPTEGGKQVQEEPAEAGWDAPKPKRKAEQDFSRPDFDDEIPF